MTEERVDRTLRDLEAALAIEPSANLSARVRTQVAQSSKGAGPSGGWQLASAGVVGAMVIASVLAWRGRHESPPVVGLTAAHVGTPSVPQIVSPAPAPVQTANTPNRVARNAVHAHEPEVLVPPDEAIALSRLVLALRDGRTQVPPVTEVPLDADGRLPLPAAIEMPPITIVPLGPPASGARRNDQ
jgi:hypothetical protein